MPSTESQPRGTSARGCLLKVLCWQCLYVLNPVLFLLTLPEHTHASRPRCGVELMAALEFVCGDRGFYRARTGGRRARPRGKGIIEQCCVEGGCDLQYLESYCATPKRARRHAADNTQKNMEQMFRALFLRRYEQLAPHTADRLEERIQYLKTRRGLHDLTIKHPPLPGHLQDEAPLQHGDTSATTTERHSNSDPTLQHNTHSPTEWTRLQAFK